MAYKDGLIYDVGIDIGRDIYTVLGIPPTADGYNINYACGNAHGKINKKSAIKPYEYDYAGELTDAMRKAINYGMTPVAVDTTTESISAYVWGQWTPPTVWMRWTDFGGYYHRAGDHVAEVQFASERNGVPIVKINASDRASYYYGKLSLNPVFHQLLLSHFTYQGVSMANMRLTLWIGGGKSSTGFTQKWVAQSEQTLAEWMSANPGGGTWKVSMRTTDIADTTAGGIGSLKQAIDNAGGSLVALGLAPTYSKFPQVAASDPATPFTMVAGDMQTLVSVRMYQPTDWMKFYQWHQYSNPGYYGVGDNVAPTGAYPLYLYLNRREFDIDYNTYRWAIVPASEASRNGGVVTIDFKDTILTQASRTLPGDTKAKLTAHIRLWHDKGSQGVDMVEEHSIDTEQIMVDTSRQFRFEPKNFKSNTVTFTNTINQVGRYLTLEYQLNPANVTFYDLDGNPSNDPTVKVVADTTSDGAQMYNGLSTGRQILTV